VGTATTFLVLGLARTGHRVDVLYVGAPPEESVDPEWASLYADAGVEVRLPPIADLPVEPDVFASICDTEHALRAAPPDVVIAHEFGAPIYTALRARQLGLAFEHTLFVLYCHGTQRFAKHARNARLSPQMLALNVLEQATLELADALVSPSEYLLRWMRDQRWRLPERTRVIPYLTRSAALGEPPRMHEGAEANGRVERLAFFGRLEETKGLRPFAGGLNRLDPRLLEGVELEFIGRTTKGWTRESVEALLSDDAKAALRRVSFETELDQQQALAHLRRAGTLAVMPSLQENSPNTVYECLEWGIPFIASRAGGIGELVDPADRARVLFEPTAEGVEAALRRALAGAEALRPARPAFDAASSLAGWAEVVTLAGPAPARPAPQPSVDAVVVSRGAHERLARCLAALAAQSYAERTLIVSGRAASALGELNGAIAVDCEGSSVEHARAAALAAGSSPWVVFLDEEDVPEPDLLETLVRAQAASGADIVSCGLALTDGGERPRLHLFAGEPGALGLLANDYGTVALLRRSLLAEQAHGWPVVGDPDWPLLAGLSAAGARIVSVPRPLVRRSARPGTIEQHPADALLVIEQLERSLPDPLRSVARLAAGLAADRRSAAVDHAPGILRRVRHVLRSEGLLGLARRSLRRLLRSRR
jgi:glycosyltransferase involved in cell wall biosynthesis